MRKPDSILWTSPEAAVVTGGENTSAWSATGVSMNINDLKPGDLFVASREDNLDLVFKKGAAAVLQTRSDTVSDKLPTLRVGDVFEALQSLARAARYKTHATIIAVQGKTARTAIQSILAKAGSLHRAGRHLSLSLAGLPADGDYGVFGLSPAVRPDIAVITNCEAARRDTLFENMPPYGAVIINADDEGFIDVLSRAKAAGLTHIYSYGRSGAADVRVREMIEAGNGIRLSVDVLGDRYTFLLDSGFEYTPPVLAALMILKLTDKCIAGAMKPYANILDQKVSAGNAVTLIDPALEKAEAVFRITNMIDLGFGRQTAMLDNLATPAHKALSIKKKNLAIPSKLANLDFVYTSKGFGAVIDARAVIRENHGNAPVAPIVPDVLAPGDFVVFKDVWSRSRTALSEVLRLVPHAGKRPKNAV